MLGTYLAGSGSYVVPAVAHYVGVGVRVAEAARHRPFARTLVGDAAWLELGLGLGLGLGLEFARTLVSDAACRAG